ACSSADHNYRNEFKVGAKVAVEANLVCIPKKDSAVTLECKYGLEVDSTYYALENIPRRAVQSNIIRAGNQVTVYGKAIEAKADSIYQASAAIDVHRIELKKEAPEGFFEDKVFYISLSNAWQRNDATSEPWSMISSQTGGEKIVT